MGIAREFAASNRWWHRRLQTLFANAVLRFAAGRSWRSGSIARLAGRQIRRSGSIAKGFFRGRGAPRKRALEAPFPAIDSPLEVPKFGHPM
jgi:hypothetical protein